MLLNGSGVVQPVDVGDVAGAEVAGVEVDGADVTVPGAGSMPGGNHPPLKHAPPPIATKGSDVAHPPKTPAGAVVVD
jgi:hypothetical protein